MKRLCSFLLLPLIIMFPAASFAEQKIAIVDLERALAGSKLGQKAQAEYQKEVQDAQTEIDKKKTQFDKLQDAFERQKNTLSAEALRSREEELMTMERDLKRSFQDSQEALRRRNAQLVGELVRKIREAVVTLGEEKGYTLILESTGQAVLFADKSIDITDEVVRKFNEQQ